MPRVVKDANRTVPRRSNRRSPRRAEPGVSGCTQTGPADAWKQAFRRRLLAWYRANRRDLPWRRTSDPYAIWVSEIMLQQTQVSTVVPYYTRFLSAFPDVRTLSAAREQDVLKLWEGLGYYRRARQMHKAARIIVDQHGGVFPHELDAVRTLPGIGRYTAAAIVSIAFDAPAAILEANTARLFARLLAFRGDTGGPGGCRVLWQLAEELLPDRDAGTFNQALMELGSLVCSPRAPQCHECPVRPLCPTFRGGLQEAIPAPRAKPRIEAVREASVVVWRHGKVLVRKRGAAERWAGMWDFPRFPLTARRQPAIARELSANVERLVGIVAEPGERITTIKHSVTRFHITLDCYTARFVSAKRTPPANGEEVKWLDPDQLSDVPLSTSARKLSRLLSPPAAGQAQRRPAASPYGASTSTRIWDAESPER
jgi:A/G-specific adenine glycosylase